MGRDLTSLTSTSIVIMYVAMVTLAQRNTVQWENLAGIKFGEMAKKRLHFDIGKFKFGDLELYL